MRQEPYLYEVAIVCCPPFQTILNIDLEPFIANASQYSDPIAEWHSLNSFRFDLLCLWWSLQRTGISEQSSLDGLRAHH